MLRFSLTLAFLSTALPCIASPCTKQPALCQKAATKTAPLTHAQREAQQDAYNAVIYKWASAFNTAFDSLPWPDEKQTKFTEEEEDKLAGNFSLMNLLCEGVQAQRKRVIVPAEFKIADQQLFVGIKNIHDAAEKVLNGDYNDAIGEQYERGHKQFGDAMLKISALLEKVERQRAKKPSPTTE